MQLGYLEEVEFDLDDGRGFYDRQESGIGDYFVDSIPADAESLPFAIYYLLSEEQVTVCAILDMRRDPAWVRAELENRERSERRSYRLTGASAKHPLQPSTQKSECARGQASDDSDARPHHA